jgi:phosphatidylglycerophosphatase A
LLVGAVHWFLPGRESQFLWIGLIASVAGGVFCANQVVRREGSHDPSKVVIDEIAGQFLTLLFVPVSLVSLVVGFFLFRIADIFKPFPARTAERLPDGWGIMADDLVAGIYAGLALVGLQFVM